MADETKNSFVDAQLHFLEEQAPPEDWKLRHDIAMFCGKIEDFIPHVLATLDSIKRRARLYSQNVREMKHPELPDEEAQLTEWYRRWHKIAEDTVEMIRFLEAQGHKVARSTDLRFAVNEVTIYMHADEVQAARMRIHNGEGRTLDEIVNGLSAKAL